jgi:hypothetical protein
MSLCAVPDFVSSHAGTASTTAPLSAMPAAWQQAAQATTSSGLRLARLPFDTMRAQYANAVRAGLIERSILASRDFERTVDTLERMTLGPWARRV